MAFFSGKKFTLGMELSSRWLKIIQIDRKNKEKPFVYLLPLEPDSLFKKGYIRDRLREINKTHRKVIRTKDIILCMSSIYPICRIVEIEKSGIEVREAIEWELEQQLIGNLKEYYYDFCPIERFLKPDTQSFLVSAIRRDQIEPVISEIRSAKFNLVALEIEGCSIINLFEYCYPEDKEEAVAIIEISFVGYKYFIVYKGAFLSYNIEIHSEQFQNLDDKEKVVYMGKLCQYLQDKIKATPEKNRYLNDKEISKIYLYGDIFFQNKELMSLITSKFTIPSFILNPFKGTTLENENYSVLCSVPMGLAFRE